MKVLILGASGMVGSKFVESYQNDLEILVPDEHELDLTEERSVIKFFESHPEIEAVVNFAAYTNVSEGQKMKGDKESVCWRVNVDGASNLAEAIRSRSLDSARDASVFLVHISTDMVFPGDEGDKGPYAEDHKLDPDEKTLTWYGYTKAMAEKILSEKLNNLAILRIIYPVTKAYELKMDYLRGPLSFFEKNGQLYPVFDDQQMNISDIGEINLAIKKLLEKRVVGVFHGGAADISSPYIIMRKLFELVYGNSEMVKAGKLSEFLKTTSDPTRYPMYGGLVNTETQRKLGIKFSTCGEIVDRLYR